MMIHKLIPLPKADPITHPVQIEEIKERQRRLEQVLASTELVRDNIQRRPPNAYFHPPLS
jgi:hypothetical protein